MKKCSRCTCVHQAALEVFGLSHSQPLEMDRIETVFGNHLHKCDNTKLQLKKSKRITVRHFYSLVPMSVVSSPKATS